MNKNAIRNIPPSIWANRTQSKDYQACIHQNGSCFGFIPLTDLKTYKGPKMEVSAVPLLEAHKIIRNSKLPNFLKCRIPVDTQLKVKAWESRLVNYWDNQLIDLIRFGFPLDFDRSRTLIATESNHASAINHDNHVKQYI